MPELPEVETTVRSIRPRLIGQRILQVRLARKDIVSPVTTDLAGCLAGRRIVSVDRRGKRIVLSLDNDCRFYVHLGMTGQLTASSRTNDPSAPHTHLRIDLESGQQLRFRDARRFGGIWWLGHRKNFDDGIGPEPLLMRPRELADRLARTGRAIKTALLDQKLLAGVGNIYADESLFLSGIHPRAPANSLSAEQVARLSKAIKKTLRRAIRHGGSSLRDYVDANGISGRYQSRHKVYGRGGHPCRQCDTPIERILIGGRSTHFCSKCQAPSSRRREKRIAKPRAR